MSMQSLIDDTVEFAKDMLRKSPSHQLVPVALCFGPNGNKVIPAEFDNNDEKHEFYRKVGAVCRVLNLQVAVLVNEAAMRELKTEKEMDFVRENYDTESPLSYPESLRTECIIISGHNFFTGETFTVTQPYRVINGIVEFHRELMRMPDAKSALVDNLDEGWSACLTSGDKPNAY